MDARTFSILEDINVGGVDNEQWTIYDFSHMVNPVDTETFFETKESMVISHDKVIAYWTKPGECEIRTQPDLTFDMDGCELRIYYI